MVNIHHHRAQQNVEDQKALEEFQQQWHAYQKLVDSDLLAHHEVYGMLHQVLQEHFGDRPFNFLELACGDAGSTVQALTGTSVAHYHGLDLSEPALELARRNLERLSCPVELEERDFISAMRSRPEPAEVVWVGLSLHHLSHEGKRELIKEARGCLGQGGLMLIYEPVLAPGETRSAYLARLERISRPLWGQALTPEELGAVFAHIKECDYPETAEEWLLMALDGGFRQGEVLFAHPTGLYAMFCSFA
eukprot:TRINITY_DN18304_c0_g1_i1.p10 TRINITY_DN18304_c0_g1~~TRINITY_DN18304_c0_g1_i1.p10  ORF type:complete len:248 (-),score=94.63 TRINITY_DN18304_c0_g1_i1:1747-2490(-)